MPIPTDADEWTDAEKANRFRDRVIDYFANHPNHAFHSYELADEITGTSWDDYFTKEQLIEEVGEDEYYENRDQYDADHGIESDGFSGPYNAAYRLYLLTHLDALVRDEQVEERMVPIEDTNLPVESWEEIRFYTYVSD